MINDVVLGTGSSIQICWFFQNTIGSGESPKDSGIQYGTFLRIGMQQSLTIHATVEPAILLILHFVEPKAKDVVFQNILHLRFQFADCFVHYLLLNWIFVNQEYNDQSDNGREQ